MVHWRSKSVFAAFLRVSRCYPSKIAPRPVTTAAPNWSSITNPKSPVVPLDDGDHDPDIDLITLRRRRTPLHTSKQSTTDYQTAESESKSKKSADEPPSGLSPDRPEILNCNDSPGATTCTNSTKLSKLH